MSDEDRGAPVAGSGQPPDLDELKGGRLKLERFLPYRLAVASTLASRALARIYSHHFGLGIPEWRVMAMLGQFERLTARDVGELSHMHKTKVSRAVTALVDRGLVEKRANRDDRREAFLSLTRPGRRIYDELTPVALAFEERMLEGIPAGDLVAFERVLSVLTERGRVLSAGFTSIED